MRQNQLIVSFKKNIGSCILMGKIAFVTIYINHTKLILFSQESGGILHILYLIGITCSNTSNTIFIYFFQNPVSNFEKNAFIL